MLKKALFILGAACTLVIAWSGAAAACGGFFCQNDPVDQTGERIVYTVNDDETITTLIEIQYQGEAADFSWILPIPEAITADDLAVPDDGQAVFDELHQLTDVQFIAPELPQCAQDDLATAAVAESFESESDVEIFASGEVGPFGFDVIGSENPTALIDWLRDTNYQVTPEMEPLINIYVEQQFAFVAMRLLDGETSDSIQPIEITYGGTEPMIPLQLTAVAAQPNMPIWVWIFGEHRAVPLNFAEMEIATEEITFFPFGGQDYQFLVQERANALDGHAFITEYAQPVTPSTFTHPWLAGEAEAAPYLTRLNTYIDPEEMTADPTFGFDETLGDVSNIRDATGLDGLYSCERDGGGGGLIESIFGGGAGDAIDPTNETGQVVAFTPGAESDTAAVSQPEEPDAQDSQDTDAQGSQDTDAQGSQDTVAAPVIDEDSGSSGLLIGLAIALAALALVLSGYFTGRRRSS